MKKYKAYLDIETTGLSRHDCELTVVGIGLEKGRKIEVVQLIEDDLYEGRLLEAHLPLLTHFFVSANSAHIILVQVGKLFHGAMQTDAGDLAPG